ncbi:MAG TPA: NAD(P)H-binding protein [Candidatus Sulfotelmatobacter sp.]|nr:NAD(P)H-binding protein [Candidatus Sulfotelmatobacter sp.]HUE52017.1 NAD(P)H-binding protein [Terriglobales bacterium]
MANPILATGAAGRAGGVGRTITEQLLKQGKTGRAMVRNEDERAQTLRDMGAEVVIGDLLDLDSMHRVIAGCKTMYFGMSVSDAYLAATVDAAVAKHHGVKAFINMSQMTVSQMSITATTPRPQHKLHWLAEQALNWSGLPVVHVRPTVFLEGFFLTLTPDSVRESDQIKLPFGEGKTSPVAPQDVAHAIAALLANPQPHIRQDLSPDGSAVREHAFLCIGVFEGAGSLHRQKQPGCLRMARIRRSITSDQHSLVSDHRRSRR